MLIASRALLRPAPVRAQRAAGESPWEHACRLRARPRSGIDGTRAPAKVIGDMAAYPAGVAARNSPGRVELLTAEPQFAQDRMSRGVHTPSDGVAAGGDFGNSTIANAGDDGVRRRS